jgi:5S rRNA maturation endonuclease (ribonuclease M5)
MIMQAEELLEKITVVIEELKQLNLKIPVIVEGEADVRALRNLGLTGDIIPINRGQGLFNFCEDLSKRYKEVLILTDWDRKGGHLCRILSDDLKANDLYFNTEIRAKLAGLCKKETKDVEGLPGCLERLNLRIKDMN